MGETCTLSTRLGAAPLYVSSYRPTVSQLKMGLLQLRWAEQSPPMLLAEYQSQSLSWLESSIFLNDASVMVMRSTAELHFRRFFRTVSI